MSETALVEALKKRGVTDPLEQIVGAALMYAGVPFLADSEPGKRPTLDFFLCDLGLYIEVKAMHSNRIAAQMAQAENVIALQGRASVEWFASLLSALSQPPLPREGEWVTITPAMYAAGWSKANEVAPNALGIVTDTACGEIFRAMLAAAPPCPDLREVEALKDKLSFCQKAYSAELATRETAEAQLAEARAEIERLTAALKQSQLFRNRDEDPVEYQRLVALAHIDAQSTIATLTAQRDKLMEAGKPFANWPSAAYQFPPSDADFARLQAVHNSIGEVE